MTTTTTSVPGITLLETQPTRVVKVAKPPDKRGWWWGTGRRKTAVARVRLRPASGPPTITIISKSGVKRTPEEYFTEERDRKDCVAALRAAGMEGKFEVVAMVHGGGFMGQAQAIRLGIARALRDYDPTCERALREAGFLTRDAREVERKKYGQAGARRRFQFSKR
jgi:small subunit ribosomal protein S9